jgi:hypothetical protein
MRICSHNVNISGIVRILGKQSTDMSKTIFLLSLLALFGTASAQDPSPAVKGANYGAAFAKEGTSVPIGELDKRLNNDKFTGRVTGKVLEVCQEKGCWMRMDRGNGETLMVKFKDYGFFMPKDIVGKEVLLDGEAVVKQVSVKQQQHYAKDAGKSEEEIARIKEPKRELQFVAKGVIVL